MKRILFAGRKGGTGRTTLAEEVAYSFDRTETPYTYFDLNPVQRHEEILNPKAVVQIADTSSLKGEELEHAARLADIIVIPTGCAGVGGGEAITLEYTVDLVRAANPEAQLIIVHNMTNHGKLCQEYREWIAHRFPAIPVYSVPQSEVLVQASTLRRSIHAWAHKGNPASKSIKALVDAIRTAAGLEPEVLNI